MLRKIEQMERKIKGNGLLWVEGHSGAFFTETIPCFNRRLLRPPTKNVGGLAMTFF